MAERSPRLDAIIALASDLEAAGHQPVLVGGMALVMLGSQRVTKDFDLLIAAPEPTAEPLVRLMYARGFELVTKFAPTGEVQRTVDNATVAAIRVKTEQPRTLPFHRWSDRVTVDLMRDFPVPAKDIAARAGSVTVDAGTVHVAATPDLLKLKEIARKGRSNAADAQDIEFLNRLLKKV